MFYWSQVPFVRILLLYIAGILAFNFYAANGSRFTLLLFFFIFFFFILKQSQKLLKYRIQGIILNFLLVLLGIFTTFLNQEEITSSLHYAEQENIWIGEIQSLEETSSNYLKCSINLEYILGSDSLFEVNKRPKVLSLIKKNKNTAELSVGDILSFSSKLKSIGQPLNPSEFNQKKYFQNKACI